jgi:predicted TIM-barrel fold metal-dependent hydrolase
VIVDCHTHIFPPQVVAEREAYLARDVTFRRLYDNPLAKLATAEDLLVSMGADGIDVSVAVGFAWQDAEICRLHNDYLQQAAADSGGRIVAFGTLPLAAPDVVESEMRRCVAAGMRGFGELRPDNLGFDLAGEPGEHLANLATELGCVLLFHVSEPVGHGYVGKDGLTIAAFYEFVTRHAGVTVIGAHWGGGLPFYVSMPEVRRAFDANVYVDTAASSLLYNGHIYERGADLAGSARVLFGSDYPLLGQGRSRRRIEDSGLDQDSKAAVLGGNAAKLLNLV